METLLRQLNEHTTLLFDFNTRLFNTINILIGKINMVSQYIYTHCVH